MPRNFNISTIHAWELVTCRAASGNKCSISFTISDVENTRELENSIAREMVTKTKEVSKQMDSFILLQFTFSIFRRINRCGIYIKKIPVIIGNGSLISNITQIIFMCT